MEGSWSQRCDALVVAAVGALLYVNTLKAGFLLDDTVAIRANPDVVTPDRTTLQDVWADDFWGTPLNDSKSHKSFRPLTTLTFRWTVELFGVSPWAFHVGNVVIYGVCCAVFTWFLQRLGVLSRGACVAAALLFACHPVHVENVAQLVGRADTLGMIFFVLSMDAYLSGARCCEARLMRGVAYGVLASALCFASMLCKEVGLLALACGCAFDMILVAQFLRRETYKDAASRKSLWAALLRMALAAAVSCGMLYWSMAIRGRISPRPQYIENPIQREELWTTRALWYSEVHFWYFFLLVCPIYSCQDWGFNVIPCPDYPVKAAVTYLIVFGAPLAALATAHRERVAIATALLVITFVPASGVLLVGTVLAERLLLIPSAGFALGAAAAWDAWDGAQQTAETPAAAKNNKTPPRAARGFSVVQWGVLGIVLAWYGGRTVTRNEDWVDPESLYKSGVATCPTSAKGHLQLSAELAVLGKLQEPLYRESLEKALAIYPKYGHALQNLAELHRGEPKAMELLKQALQVNPGSVEIMADLGEVMCKHGEVEEGLVLLRKAVGKEKQKRSPNPSVLGKLATGLFLYDHSQQPATYPHIDEIHDLYTEVIHISETVEYWRAAPGHMECSVRVDMLIPALAQAQRFEQAKKVALSIPPHCKKLMKAETLKQYAGVFNGGKPI
eukprot:TRINITY_DN25017_c0_g1_i1.p1 TRINITY_DN25017_c0_g1~~TRINITY_DN25017_c0_g1_i1.p1  ORF type:complete len:673 (+),score=203.08 TRINITY_DN25017_c0_g1_i1:60-2078(+)